MILTCRASKSNDKSNAAENDEDPPSSPLGDPKIGIRHFLRILTVASFLLFIIKTKRKKTFFYRLL